MIYCTNSLLEFCSSKIFLTEKECDEIIKISASSFTRSQFANSEKEKYGEGHVDEVRSSSGAWLSRGSSNFAVSKFVRRVSAWIALPQNHGEDVQVLQYLVGQEYKPHVDYFDPKIYGDKYTKNGGQRYASVLCFLNDVPNGGATIFPRAHVSVKPQKGSAVMWFNCYENGTLDSNSLHGGAPVLEGVKYVAVQWMRFLPRVWG